jgi:tetratricopeptide (TPR) repeat protein
MTFRWFASALLLWTTVASAQTSQSTPTEPASPQAGSAQVAASGKDQRSLREVLDSATKLFQAGSYDQAIVEFQVAYTKRQLPTLLFNIAQAHRKAGHWSEALALYERFLRDDPKSALLPEAEAHAAAMRARLDAERASQEREAAERLAQRRAEEAEALAKAREAERQKADEALLAAAKQKEKPIYKKAWFWGVIGGLAAAGAVTAGVVIAVQQREPSADLGVRVVEF